MGEGVGFPWSRVRQVEGGAEHVDQGGVREQGSSHRGGPVLRGVCNTWTRRGSTSRGAGSPGVRPGADRSCVRVCSSLYRPGRGVREKRGLTTAGAMSQELGSVPVRATPQACLVSFQVSSV